MRIEYILIGIGIALISFILGWVFPIEGPYDYLYDNLASQPAHKSPFKTAPLIEQYHIMVDVNDLSEEDFEALQDIFRNKVKE